ncbi:MAG: ABC transporter permease [Bdellovibrionales bacterium]|nr:ABC transporter permease [Bdellovibrionales bacterium]
MFNLWVGWKYLKSEYRFMSFTSWLGVFGLTIGVASLFVSMAVVSGYETTLKRNVIDVTGDLTILKRGFKEEQVPSILEEVKSLAGASATHWTPFVFLEGLLAHNKKIKGIMLEGIDPKSYGKVLHYEHRIIEGEKKFNFSSDESRAWVGKGLKKKFNLQVGDSFKVVLPIDEEANSNFFKPIVKKFKLMGFLDLGRFEYNERYILTDMETAQNFARLGDRITGIRLKLPSSDLAQEVMSILNEKSEMGIWTKSWREHNKNIFEAVVYEKAVIFFVLLVMVIAASFNVSSTLFVSVMQRFSDISVMKAIGAKRRQIVWIFSIQGLIIGVLGTFFGLLIGVAASYGFLIIQDLWHVLPAETYKIDHIDIEFRALDIVLIGFSTLLICFLSTLGPALRGARLKPVEGLKYE